MLPPVCRDGYIKAVGPADVIHRRFAGATFESKIDCTGKCVLPGGCSLPSWCRTKGLQACGGLCRQLLLCLPHLCAPTALSCSEITCAVFPLGLVDAHTHPVWAGDRVHEFAMKVMACNYRAGFFLPPPTPLLFFNL